MGLREDSEVKENQELFEVLRYKEDCWNRECLNSDKFDKEIEILKKLDIKVEEALNPVARIIKNKNNEDLLAIVNLSNKIWNATTPSGKTKKVANKELIPLKEGINIMVENLKIEIIKN